LRYIDRNVLIINKIYENNNFLSFISKEHNLIERFSNDLCVLYAMAMIKRL